MNARRTILSLVLPAIFMLTAFTAYAATINVPADYTTIQAAIDASVNGDTINVAAGTYTENIDFSGKLITVKSTDGPETTIIDGNASGSVVVFQSGENNTAVLDGFGITNGTGNVITEIHETYTLGGGILAYNSSPTIQNCHIYENTASCGAGIDCENADSIIIDNCQITDNDGYAAGVGISMSGCDSPAITDCYLQYNRNIGTYIVFGGGIYANTSSPVIDNCIIDNNLAYYGGGIYCTYTSTPVVSNSIIKNNNSNSNQGDAGIVARNEGCSITIDNCMVIFNEGGIKIWEGATALIQKSTIAGNTNVAGGGLGTGIRIQSGSSAATLEQCNITGNDSNGIYLADIFSDTPLTLINCVVSKNGGTGVLSDDHYFSYNIGIKNCTITENQGDGLYVGTSTTANIINSIIWDNPIDETGTVTVTYSDVEGGWSGTGNISDDPQLLGVHLTGTSPCIDAGTATDAPAEDIDEETRPQATGIDMGADEYSGAGPETLQVPSQYATIQEAINKAKAGDTVLVSNGTYYENLFLVAKAITLKSENGYRQTIIDGGGDDAVVRISAIDNYECVLNGFTITNGYNRNTWNAFEAGGGISCTGYSSPVIQNCLVEANITTGPGGAGIFLNNHASPKIINTKVVNNSIVGQGDAPGILCFEFSSPKIINTTISGNYGDSFSDAGGIYSNVNSSPTVINCIIWNNDGAEIDVDNNSSITISHSNIQGGYTGTGNIDSDPLFIDPKPYSATPESGGDYHLQAGSPCIDMGTSATDVSPDLPAEDIDGDTRPQGISHDIGADETAYANTVQLDLMTDNAGNETSWEIRDNADQVVASGSGYANNTQYIEDVNLANGEYTFTIFDSSGDGICCANGSGYYTLTHLSTNEIVAQGDAFGSSESTDFEINVDFGDAPAPYPTLMADDGARHITSPGYLLGAFMDAEYDGQPDAGAAGDDNTGVDDENGVTFDAYLIECNLIPITITASTAGYIDAWIDFNADGDWADAGEQIFTSQVVVAGANNLNFTVPCDAVVGNSFARFRFSSTGGLSYTGTADDGEVEDYIVSIEGDLDGDGLPDSIESATCTAVDKDDTDGDTLLDGEEDVNLNGVLDAGETDPCVADTDGDGMEDGDEKTYWGDQWNADSDSDGLINILDPDSDNDGYSDWDEIQASTDPADPDSHLSIDFGDAPDPAYPTLEANNGARHNIVSGFYLGAGVDYDLDGQPDANAAGDDNDGNDDEDGVSFDAYLVICKQASVSVTASANGYIDAWIDFNADGDWADAGEQVFTSQAVVTGANDLNFAVPCDATTGQTTFARFRFSSTGGLSYTGPADDGEVEDYVYIIIEEANVSPQIATYDDHTVGLKLNGTVVAVGDNGYGQCDVSDWFGISQVDSGCGHTVGLKIDGTVVAVGYNSSGQCDVGSWTGIVQVVAGCNFTIGLKTDGTAIADGWNISGQCNVSSWTDIKQITAGGSHTLGLKTDGTVVAVGSSSDGKCDVSSWTSIVQVSANSNHTVGLKSDGTVVAVGSNSYGQCDVSSWTGIVQVSAGYNHTVGLKTDGTVVAVGYNSYGQCDVGSWADIVQVAAGNKHTVGLKTDGTVVAVGYNYQGQCDVDSWNLGTESVISFPNLIDWNGNLVADFGDNGMWYNNGTSWTWMTNTGHVGQMVNWDGKLVVDFGEGGLQYYDGAWHWMTNKGNPNMMIVWDNGATEKLVVDFGAGQRIYTYDGSWNWFKNKDDVADMTVWSNKLIVDFGAGRGLYNYDGSWNWMSNKDDVAMMLPWDNGTTEKLVVDFGGGRRIYTYDGAWNWFTNKDDVNDMVVWNNKLVVDFGGGRLVYTNDGAWNWLTNKDNVAGMVTWRDAGTDLAFDFGNGRNMYNYNGTWTWIKNANNVPEMLPWNNRLAVDFGTGIGIYNFNGSWHQMKPWSTAD